MEKMVISGVRELAEALGVSVNTALALTRRADFPSAKLGKRTVTPVAALNEWLAKGGTAAKGA